MTWGKLSDVGPAFRRLAVAICDEIETQPPDLIVVLHCSGAVVWRAVEQLWMVTRARPLPPVTAIRINQGSPRQYWKRFEPNGWEWMDEDRVGHMVAWSARVKEWRTAMQRRLHSALGDAACRDVLVVDDVMDDGWTALTAFGVILSAAPKARLRLMAGVPGFWREILGHAWLAATAPQVMERMVANWPDERAMFFRYALNDKFGQHWSALVSGLEGGGEDALSSRPLDPARLPYAGYLTRYMSAEQWLEFPRWVQASLTAEVEAELVTPAPMPTPDERWARQKYSLSAHELIWLQAWQQRWSTVDEFAERCNVTATVAQEMLEKIVDAGDFVRRETENGSKYGRAKVGVY